MDSKKFELSRLSSKKSWLSAKKNRESRLESEPEAFETITFLAQERAQRPTTETCMRQLSL